MAKAEVISRRCVRVITLLFFLSLGTPAFPEDVYLEMSLEDLMDVEIVSVSKKPETFQDVASSIYVISEEDIRRSGATRLVEVLNLVPGTFFADYTYNSSNSGIRSGGSPVPQSVLLLVDGFPMNSPASGGIPYDFINVPLQQIDRIEVIKGPGGTIYGAGANTGIISIFTKTANDNKELLVSVQGGLQDYASPYLRYNRTISDNSAFMIYGSYKTTRGYDKPTMFNSSTITAPRPDEPDTLVANRFIRTDTDGKEAISLGAHLQSRVSDKLTSNTRLSYTATATKQYQNLHALPIHIVKDRESSALSAQERFDYTFHHNHQMFLAAQFRKMNITECLAGTYKPNNWILNFEVQDNIRLASHDLSFGANYRAVKYDIQDANDDDDMGFTVLNTTETLYAAFVQDKIAITDRVDFTAGIKAETWTLISKQPEYSPSLRLTVKPKDNVTLWSAYSHSITTPGFLQTRIEVAAAEIPYIPMQTSHLFLEGTDELYAAVIPGPDVQPIRYDTYELGLRANLSRKVNLDLSMFYTAVDGDIGMDPNFMMKAPLYSSLHSNRTILPIYYTNTSDDKMFGGELVARLLPVAHLRTELSYSLLKIESEAREIPEQPGQYYALSDEVPDAPEHTVRFRTYLDFPRQGWYLSTSAIWRSEYSRGEGFDYVDQVEPYGMGGVVIDPPQGEINLNLMVEKKFYNDQLSVNLWGRNLLADERFQGHLSYVEIGYPHSVHRTFGGGLSCQF